jgi:hypothetical protein
LEKIYGFADWCASQKEKELWNAAGVAFYEHLADSNRTLEAIHLETGFAAVLCGHPCAEL